MRRHGISIIEVLVGSCLLATVITIAISGFNVLGRQSRNAFDALSQSQEALLLIEGIRMELSSLVLNPFNDGHAHQGNSFLISRPNGTSIQFVMERRDGTERQRYLVYYEAANPAGAAPGTGLRLRKTVWKFNQHAPWNDPIVFPPGWPSSWIGQVVETQESRYAVLRIQDMRWDYFVPEENEGRVFFRVKLVIARESGKLVPFSTLVGVQTPDLPATISDCPCLFAPCFKSTRDCDCCVKGGGS